MSWLRISDDFTDRRELLELGEAEAIAGWTYLRLLCWAASHLSDGVVPVGAARREDQRGVEALVSIGYATRRADGGLELPRFLSDHHLSRAAVLELRENRAQAGRRGGQASALAKAEAKAQALAEANAKHGVKQNGNPVSRLPSPVNPGSRRPSTRAARVTAEEIEMDHV